MKIYKNFALIVSVAAHKNSRGNLCACACRMVRALFSLAMVSLTTSVFAVAPVLTPPSNLTVTEDSGRTNLTFTVTDADTAFFAVTVTATSSNPTLVPNTNLVVVGSGTIRTLGVTPQTNASGSATITMVASDGTSNTTNSFALTVTAVNDAPVIGSLSSLTILEDAGSTNRTVIV